MHSEVKGHLIENSERQGRINMVLSKWIYKFEQRPVKVYAWFSQPRAYGDNIRFVCRLFSVLNLSNDWKIAYGAYQQGKGSLCIVPYFYPQHVYIKALNQRQSPVVKTFYMHVPC